MKNARIRHRVTTVLLVCAVSFSLSAQGVEVPDLETRIRNSGSQVPPSALPALALPAPIPLPPPPAVPDPGPVAPPVLPPVSVEGAHATSVEPMAGQLFTGFAELGAGMPGAFHGAVSLKRAQESASKLGIDFSYDSADGYSGKSPGSGWFDRSALLALTFGSAPESRPWDASLSLTEDADGLQGKSEYYGILARRADWNGSVRAFGADSGITGTVGLSGSVWTFGGERSAFSPPPAPSVADHDGYRLAPTLAVAGTIASVDLKARSLYSYDTVAGSGELHAVRQDIEAGWARGAFAVQGSVGLHYDDEDSLAVPFALSLALRPGSSPIRALILSGGIAVGRMDSSDLAESDPFVLRAGLPVYSADWNAKASAEFTPREELRAFLSGEFRKSLDGRGILVAGQEASASVLIPYGRVERDSFVTEASLSWTRSALSLTGAYVGEWLDDLGRDSLHSVSASATVRGGGSERPTWSSTAGAGFALDSAELPKLSLSFAVRPIERLEVRLSAMDLLAMAGERDRMVNDVYTERSGEAILSLRVEF